MKWLLFLFCLPVAAFAQTIHFDDENIVYENVVPVPGLLANQIFSRLQSALLLTLEKSDAHIAAYPNRNTVEAKSAIDLNAPFHIIRKVHFTISATAKEAGYTYRIDSVYVTERRRGSSQKTKTAEDLLEGMEATGADGTTNERLLNEIDMRFQKILVLLEKGIREQKK